MFRDFSPRPAHSNFWRHGFQFAGEGEGGGYETWSRACLRPTMGFILAPALAWKDSSMSTLARFRRRVWGFLPAEGRLTAVRGLQSRALGSVSRGATLNTSTGNFLPFTCAGSQNIG